jgi:hypothetical protein
MIANWSAFCILKSMKKLFTKICVVLMLCGYIVVSQFIFKAIATTSLDLVDLEVDSVCYGKKIDTFDSQTSCRKKSFITQAWSDKISLEQIKSSFSQTVLVEYVLDTLSTIQLITYVQLIRPPPDNQISRVHKYSYIWVLKSVT